MEAKFDIRFNEHVPVPKYVQIIEAVQEKIKTGMLKKGDQLPSLNYLCREHNLSQDTVLTAYQELKAKGVITSQVGKGYFVQSDKLTSKHKILLVFDKLTAYKEELYESFIETIGRKGTEQIFFHNNNLRLFQTILESAAGEFTEYIIMPPKGKEAYDMICLLPKNKVFILDIGKKQYGKTFPYVCQNFERDIYCLLKAHVDKVNKYKRFILAKSPKHKVTMTEISKGFRSFCKQHPIDFEIISDIKTFQIQPKDAFIVIDDRDLEYLINWSLDHHTGIGDELGILSYNEISWKAMVAKGITTISTDFIKMGENMAHMILNKKKQKIENPFLMYERASF